MVPTQDMLSCWNLVCNIRGTKSTAPKGEGKQNKKLIDKKFLWTAEGVRKQSSQAYTKNIRNEDAVHNNIYEAASQASKIQYTNLT